MSLSPVSPRLIISCRRHVIPFPRPTACLARWRRLVRHLVISGNLLACRSSLRSASRFASRPSLRPASRPPLGDVIDFLLNRSSCRSELAVINRPDLLVGWLGAGRDEHSSSSPVRLDAAACLLRRGASASVPIAAVCSACLDAAVCVGIVLAELYI